MKKLALLLLAVIGIIATSCHQHKAYYYSSELDYRTDSSWFKGDTASDHCDISKDKPRMVTPNKITEWWCGTKHVFTKGWLSNFTDSSTGEVLLNDSTRGIVKDAFVVIITKDSTVFTFHNKTNLQIYAALKNKGESWNDSRLEACNLKIDMGGNYHSVGTIGSHYAGQFIGDTVYFRTGSDIHAIH